MDSVELYQMPSGGLARRAGRAIARQQAGGQVRTAKVDIETNIAADHRRDMRRK